MLELWKDLPAKKVLLLYSRVYNGSWKLDFGWTAGEVYFHSSGLLIDGVMP